MRRPLALLAFLALPACKQDAPAPRLDAAPAAAAEPDVVLPPAPPVPPLPGGLPEMQIPADNPVTPEKVALGKLLFFDPRLSKDGSMSCETCHQHALGWTDAKPLSPKFDKSMNTRHTPTLYNVGFYTSWYWDGRAPTLEKQIEAAWKGQMGADPPTVAAALAKVPLYRAYFKKVFGGPPTAEAVPKALAAFLRTLNSGDSAWDRYEKGDAKAVPADAVAGWKVFRDKAQCTLCHVPPLFSDGQFHNTGIGMDKPDPDPGRKKVSNVDKELGAFKTPTLRSVTRSGPYFHDGREANLESVVKLMAAGGIKNPQLDEKLKAYKLTAREVAQVMAFLKALESTEPFEKPTLP